MINYIPNQLNTEITKVKESLEYVFDKKYEITCNQPIFSSRLTFFIKEKYSNINILNFIFFILRNTTDKKYKIMSAELNFFMFCKLSNNIDVYDSSLKEIKDVELDKLVLTYIINNII